MLLKLSHLENRGRKSTSLNETKIYVADEIQYVLKNNPEVKFQRKRNKVQERILNTTTDNTATDN